MALKLEGKSEYDDGYHDERLTYEPLMQIHLSPENGTSGSYLMKADFLQELRPQ